MSVGCVQTEHCGHRLRGGSGDTTTREGRERSKTGKEGGSGNK